MAYQTGSATDLDDLMNKLQTFAAANGFTVDNHDATGNFLSISRPADNLYLTYYWGNSDDIMVWQALGYSATHKSAPWNQTDDSGNGDADTSTPETGRNISQIGNGPFTAYHFFGYTNPHSLLVVLEFSPGLYRHFGFGMLNKSSTWTGGAWVSGHVWNRGGSPPYSAFDDPSSLNHTILLDNLLVPGQTLYNAYSTNAGATVHIEGFQTEGQPTGGKWGQCVNPGTNPAVMGNDRGGTGRVFIAGGTRGGPNVRLYGSFLPDLANGFVPIMPIETFYVADPDQQTKKFYYLGRLENVGHIHLEGIDPAQELTIGADTWKAFPAVRKAIVGGNNQESHNLGIIYKKIT